MKIPVKNITSVAYQALFQIMESAPERQLSWMEQVGIRWMGEVAPHDNYGRIKVKWFKVGPSQRTISLPKECFYRTTRVLMKCGNSVYSLTLDPNLMLPESINFDCNANNGTIDNFWPDGTYGSLRATVAQNTNYYRINDGYLTFATVPPEGYLVLEYLSMGDVEPDTIVHAGYSDAMRLYLTWQYYEKEKDMRWAKDYERQYYERMRISNLTVKCPTLDDILDILSA